MLLASAMFALMGTFIKLASEQGASLSQIVLCRGLPSVVLLLVWARAGSHSIVPSNWRLHVWRNVAGITSMWMGFYALSQLPLATATSLNYTAPLFIAGWMLVRLGARRDLARVAAVVLGFLGVLAVLRPSVSHDAWLPALIGLGGGALSAVAMLQIRELGRVGEPPWRTVLYFSLAVCLSSLCGATMEGWGDASLAGWVFLVGVGSSGMVGQLCMTRAFGLGSALLTAALQYTTIIFAALLGMAFWNDRLDTLAWCGMAGVIAAGLLSIWRTLADGDEGAVGRGSDKAAGTG